jgi:hypothetical protein
MACSGIHEPDFDLSGHENDHREGGSKSWPRGSGDTGSAATTDSEQIDEIHIKLIFCHGYPVVELVCVGLLNVVTQLTAAPWTDA